MTKAKALSALERVTLSPRLGTVLGLAEEMPMTGRAAAIRNAVAMELGHVIRAEVVEGDLGDAKDAEETKDDAYVGGKLSKALLCSRSYQPYAPAAPVIWHDLDTIVIEACPRS